jgi:hypothetical protein
VRRDLFGSVRGAAWIELSNAFREPAHERRIDLGAPFRLPVAAPRSHFRIAQALGFGAVDRVIFDQQPLAFVPLPRGAPLQHDRGQRGVAAGTPRERGVAGRQEPEVIQIRAGEAQRAALAGENDHRPPSEVFTAFIAARIAVRNEHA